MSEKTKSREHFPTTLGRKYVNKDGKNKCVKLCDLQKYLDNDYKLGKITKNKIAWNKGLTLSDSRMLKISNTRKQLIKDKGSIGYCGRKGIDNIQTQRFIEKIKTINKADFYNDWLNNGKCYCLRKYHLTYKSYEYICSLLNIVETDQHKLFIRYKNKLNK